jgi:hypothetical protein
MFFILSVTLDGASLLWGSTMNFKELAYEKLQWIPELGIGHYPVTECPYDQDYFDKYVSYEGTVIEKALNAARVDFVKSHYDGWVVDIGIGSGTFVRAHGKAYGYDINPAGVKWLKEQSLYVEPKRIVAATFWDSFEHIEDPAVILNEVTKWVFMSIPLFDCHTHVMRSKHYRKDEHFWYFTYNGICKFMEFHGFDFVAFNRMEVDIGREDIGTFAFKRSA